MKNKSHKNRSSNSKNETQVNYLVFIALAFIIGFIPLIVRHAMVPVGPDERLLIKLFETQVEDVFSYYKSCLLIGSAALLSFYYLYRFFTSDFDFNLKALFKNPVFTAFMVYVAAVILSSLFSSFKYTALHGISERYESVFVLLSYLIIFYAVQDFIRSPHHAKLILYVLVASAFVLGLISLSQFINRDVFVTTFGRESAGFPQSLLSRLVLGSANYNQLKAANGANNLDPVFDAVYATLYNPNCVGLYGALIAPLFIITGMFWKKRSPFQFILLLTGVFVCFMILGARSSGGLLGIAAAAVVGFVMCIVCSPSPPSAQKSKAARLLAPGLAAAGTLCLIAALAFVPLIRSNLKTMVYKFYEYVNPINSFFLKDIRVQDKTLVIETEKGPLRIDLQNGLNDMILYDADGLSLALAQSRIPEEAPESTEESYNSPAFGRVVVLKEANLFVVSFSGVTLPFSMTEDNRLQPLSHMFEPVDINETIPSVGFEGRELFGSGRGYIWSRSIPLIMRDPLFGGGPDTFVLSFPQQDIVGKAKYLGNPYIIVDKPHNYYLQTAINTGLISLAALVFIFGWYVVTTFLSLLKDPHQDFGLRLGIFTGICGYLVSALATDSTVSVSPVFWAVLGLGFGMEQYAKKRRLAAL